MAVPIILICMLRSTIGGPDNGDDLGECALGLVLAFALDGRSLMTRSRSPRRSWSYVISPFSSKRVVRRISRSSLAQKVWIVPSWGKERMSFPGLVNTEEGILVVARFTRVGMDVARLSAL